jgi:hypothetical protein
MRCIALKIRLVLHQNPASNFGTTYFFFSPYEKKELSIQKDTYLLRKQ